MSDTTTTRPSDLLPEGECPQCDDIAERDTYLYPSHNGARTCRNIADRRSIAAGGQTAHCSCSGCFD